MKGVPMDKWYWWTLLAVTVVGVLLAAARALFQIVILD